MRTALKFAVLLSVGGAPAAHGAGQMLHLPVAFGHGKVSAMTVQKLVGCMEKGPIPLKLADLSDRGNGSFTARLDNDLAQYVLTFAVEKGVARLVEMDRDNGAKLSAARDLKRFADRACKQAAH